VEDGMLAEARWQRATRPRWQRAGFVAMLGVLLALQLGPDRVLVACMALILAWAIWVLVGRAGRAVVAALAVWLCWALLEWNAIPVLGLAVFARWFLATPSAALVALDHPPPPLDGGLDADGDGDPQATTPLASDGLAGGPTRAARLARPDPGLAGRVQAAWPKVAEAAGAAGAVLLEVRPVLFGWTAVIELRLGQTLDDAVRQRGALESALDAPPGAVRLEQDPTRARRVRLRVLDRDPHATPIPYPGPTAGSIRRPLSLGLSELGEPTAPSFAGYHALLVGTTGSGKSMLLNILVAEVVAAADAVGWGIDFTRGAELGPWERHGCLGRVATTPEQAEQLLLAALAVLDARLDYLASQGIRTWPTSPGMPELKIVIDEHAEVVRTCSPAALKAIDSIAERGRKVAVTLVVASLRASMDVLGSDTLRAMLKVRVCLGVEDPGEIALALGLGRGERGKWPAELLNAPGKFYLRAREQGLTVPRVHRGFELSDAHADQLAARAAHQPTSLGELSDQAAARYPAQPARPPSPPGSLGGPQPDGPPAVGGERADHDLPAGWPPARAGSLPSPTMPLGGPPGPGADPVGLLLAALVHAGPHGAKVADLAAQTGQPGPTVHAHLVALEAARQVQRCGHGRWRTTYPHRP
jgi:hypothetical protein